MNLCKIEDCRGKTIAHGLCWKHYARRRRNKTPYLAKERIRKMQPAELRAWFRRKCRITGNGCMEWNEKYKPFAMKNLSLHRSAFHLFRGEIPDGLLVVRICNNQKCLNPDHMDTLTHKENYVRQLKEGVTRRSKLTVAEVIEIKRTIAAGGIKLKDLAGRYGVHPKVIYDIKAGRRWGNVQLRW